MEQKYELLVKAFNVRTEVEVKSVALRERDQWRQKTAGTAHLLRLPLAFVKPTMS